jgi:hypothetical protein
MSSCGHEELEIYKRHMLGLLKKVVHSRDEYETYAEHIKYATGAEDVEEYVAVLFKRDFGTQHGNADPLVCQYRELQFAALSQRSYRIYSQRTIPLAVFCAWLCGLSNSHMASAFVLVVFLPCFYWLTRERHTDAAVLEKDPTRLYDDPLHDRIAVFYSKHNPAKLRDESFVESTANKFRGSEGELFSKLVKKYGAEPQMRDGQHSAELPSPIALVSLVAALVSVTALASAPGGAQSALQWAQSALQQHA